MLLAGALSQKRVTWVANMMSGFHPGNDKQPN
jgi:hypothetical protein